MGLTTRYTIKTPGFTESGSDQTPVPGNAIQMGKLKGDVNAYNITILWEYVDDDNNDAVGGVVEYRRDGTTTWFKAPNLKRSVSESAIGGDTTKSFTTVIIGLAPNTTYDVRCSISDPDGGSVTERTTTFTTRWAPRIPSDDGDAHVVTTDAEYSTALSNALAGEPIYLRASGSPYTSPVLSGKLANGAYGNPHYITAYPGENATLDQVSYQGAIGTIEHVWIDRLTISNRIHSQTQENGDGTIITRITSTNNTTNKPLQIFFSDVHVSDCTLGRDNFDGGDVIEVSPVNTNLTLMFTHLEDGNDAYSKGGGGGDNAKHRNHNLLFLSADNIGDDTIEFDNQCQGGICGYCIFGPNLGKTGISYQGQLRGWSYHYRVQYTGLRYGLDLGLGPLNIKHQYKLEGDQALQWQVGCTFIVGTNSNNKGNNQWFLLGVVNNTAPDCEGAVFMNTAWEDPETIQDGIGGISGITIPGDAAFSLPRLIDGNLYDAPNGNPFEGLTITQLQTEGHDTNSSTATFSGSIFSNYPADVDVGTASPMWPVASAAADSAGVTGSGVNGIEPFVGPYHGSSPDVGAQQQLITFPVGPRQTTGFGGTEIKQAFSLPSNMTLRDTANAHDSQYTALGLPSSVSAFGYVRLLMDRDGPTTPTSALTIQFVRWAEADVWDEYLSFLDGEVGDTIDRKWRLEGGDGKGYIRHGLGVTKLTRGNDTLILAAAVEDGGIAQMTWGVTTSDLTTTPTLERDAWEVAYSLYGEWGEVEQGAFSPSPSSAGAFVPMAMA